MVTNTEVSHYLGAGNAISNFYTANDHFISDDIDLFTPIQYEFFNFLRPRANTYRQSIGAVILMVKLLIQRKRYDINVFYGGSLGLATWFLKCVVKLRSPVYHHSNGIELHAMSVLEKLNVRQSLYPSNGISKILLKIIFEASIKYCDKIIVNASYDYDYLRKYYGKSNNTFVIEYGIDEIFRSQPYREEKLKVLGFCGSWTERKGVSYLVQSVTEFLRANPDYSLYIIGCGNDVNIFDLFGEDIHRQIQVFPFVTDRGQLRKLYGVIDIMLFTSAYDSFGLVVIEAIASSCVLLATSTGIVHSMKPNKHFFPIQYGSSESISFQLNFIVQNAEIKNRIREAGYRYAQQFVWDKSRAKLKALVDYEVNYA